MKKSNQHRDPVAAGRSPVLRGVLARAGRLRPKLLPLTIALLVAGPLLAANAAHAAAVGAATTPTGGVVVGGVGTITQDGAQTLIQQQSAKLALDWQSFNVGKDASVLFKQPSFSAVALNRILDQSPSQIFGRINSNGQVFLINTHGFIFGATAKMNVGGLLASTLDLTPKDFLANHYNLDAHGATAGIVNHGLIEAASGGSVGLVGGSVRNDGVILANYGSIHLDGADRAVLDFDGNGLIQIQVTGALQKRLDENVAAVTNSGTLKAADGTVVLQASAAKDLFTNLVNNSGVIDAGGISTAGGVVRLVASGGNTENSGSIDVSGVRGGSAQLLSDQDVMVTGQASVDASGAQGGGTIRIGGGVHGGEGLTQAERSYIAPDANLRADASQSGNGGSIAVWSTGNTVSTGTISARGGALGGNGGFVETSGLKNLTVTNAPNVGAANGVGGTWLIDPNDLIIDAGGGSSSIDTSSQPFTTTNDGASLGVDLITAALQNGNVTITTGTGGSNKQAGDITVNSGFNFDGTGGTTTQTAGTLTLNAANDINFAANQVFAGTGSYALSVDLEAGHGISFAGGSGIKANGGDVTLTAGSGITQNAGSMITADDPTGGTGNVTLTANGGDLQLNGAITGNTVALNASNVAAPATPQAIMTGGVITAAKLTGNATGDIGLSGTVEAGTAGDPSATPSPTDDVPGNVTLTSTAGTITQDAGSTLTTHGGAVSITGNALDLNGSVDASTTNASVNTNDVTLTTTGGDLLFGGTLTGHTVTLGASNVAVPATPQAIMAGGVITAAALTGNATGDITLSGTVEAGTAGDPSATPSPTVDVPGSVTLTSTTGTITQDAGSTLTTHGGAVSVTGSALNLNGSADASTTNTLANAGDVNLTATGGNLSVGGAIIGDGVTLAASTVAGQSISGSGTITATTLTGGSTGDTTLDGNNQIATLGNFSAANFSLTNAAPLTVGGALAATGGAISLISTGGPSAIAVDGAGSIAADSISLTADQIGLVGTANAGTTGTVAIQQYTSGTSISLGGTGVAGSLSVTDADLGNITAGTLSVGDGSSGALTVAGAVDGGAGTLSLNSGGAITQTPGSTITVGTLTGSSTGATTLGEANLINTLGSFTAAGFSLTNGQSLAVAGPVNGNASTTLITTAGDLAINGALSGTSTTLTSAGAISGNGIITADTLTGSSTGDTTLGGNNLVGTLGAFSAAGFTLNNVQALSIGGALTADSVDITAKGATSGITQAAGIFTVTGNSTFDAGAGKLTLDNAGNHFAGTVSLNNSGAHDVTLNNGSNALVLGTSTVGSGTLSVTAVGITQSGALTQEPTGGAATFDAGAGVLTLDSANNFTGALSLNNSGAHDVTLNNGSNALVLGTSSVGTGALSVTAAGITQGGGLTQADAAGTATFHAGAGVLTLNGANKFTGSVSLNNSDANDVTLNNGSNALVLGTSTVGSGALSVTAVGITQSGALTQEPTAGTATFDAGAGALKLDDSANNFTGALSLNNSGANDVTAVNAGALILGQSTVGGNLSVKAGGNITQPTTGSNPLTVAGTSTFTVTAPSSDVILDDAGNALTGAVTVSAASGIHNLSLTNTSSTAAAFMPPTSVTGDLALDYANATVKLSDLSGTTLGGALDITAKGITLDSDVTTAGSQTYSGPVTLSGTTRTLETTNSAVTLGGTVDNDTNTPSALTINTGSGNVTFTGAVGSGANGALGALAIGSTGTTTFGSTVNAASLSTGGAASLGGDVTTTGGAQTYGGAVTLTSSQPTTLTGSLVTLGGVSGNSKALTVAGNAALGGTLTGISDLGVTGTTALTAGSVTTTGTQTYTGAVALGADTVLTTTSSAVTFGSTLDNADTTARALTVTTGSGDVTFTGAVGGDAINGALGALTVNSTGTTAFDAAVKAASLVTDSGGVTTLGGDVITSGTQTYGDTVTLDHDTTLTGSLVTLAGVTGGGNALNVTGNAALNGALGSVGSLGVTGTTAINTGSVTTTAAQTYGGDITLGANTTLTGGVIGVQGVVGGTYGLTVMADSFSAGGAVGLGGNLAITTTTGGISQAGGAFTVGGTSSFDAGTNDISLNAANAFAGAVSLKGNNVAITNAGALELGESTVGGTLAVTAAGSITQASSGAPPTGAALSVTGASTFTVTAANSDVLLGDSGNTLGDVTIAATAPGTVNDFSLTNASVSPGTLTLLTPVGNDETLNYITAPLTLSATTVAGKLDVTAGGGITLGGNISADGGQAYHSKVLLNADTVLTTASSAVTFDSTVDNATTTAQALTVNADTGTVTFTGAVGSNATNGPLGALAINATSSGPTSFVAAVDAASLATGSGTTGLGSNVTTSGAQSYGGAVTLGSATTTLDSGSGGVSFVSTLDNATSAPPVALTVKTGTGAATFAGAVGSINDALDGLTVSGNSFATGSTLSIGSGGLSVTTTGGDIAQTTPTGGYAVTGTSTFDAGAHAITLNATNNAFGGAVSLNNGGAHDVSLDNGSNLLTLGDSALGTGALNLKANGISQATGTTITQAAVAGLVTLNAGTGAIALTNADNDFSGAVTAFGDGVQITDVNDLDIALLTSPPGFAVTLKAGGTLTLPSGLMDTGAADLELDSGGTLTLPGALSGRNITLTSGGGLTINNTVTGANAITLTSDGDLAINNTLTGTGTITLTSTAGDITEDPTTGVIVSTGGALAGTSGGSTTLLSAGNQVANLGKFVTGGDFSFNNAQSLTVDQPVLANSGAGNITLTTTGVGSNLALETQIQGINVVLGAGGAISQNAAGTIQASTLTGTSGGNTTLTGPNEVGTLNAFTSGGDFSFTNAADLTVLGPLSSSTGKITLSTNWTGVGGPLGGNLALNTGITAANVELDSRGAITQQTGTVITATTLTGAATGDVTLDGANLIGTLNDFTAANFSLVNAQGLTLAGTLKTTGSTGTAGTGDISLKTTSGALDVGSNLLADSITLDSADNLTLAKDVDGTDTVVLKSGAAINQTTGIVTAGSLSGSSVGATTLGGANKIAALGDFTAAGFSLVNGQSLAINGALDGGPTVDLTLTAGGLSEGALGVITAATLTGSTVNDTTLDGANLVGTLGNFSAANFSLTNAQSLAVNGTLTTTGGTGNISLKTTSGTLGVNSNLSGGAISLVSATDLALGQTIDGSTSVNLGAGGAITQTAGGTIQTAILTGQSGGDTTLAGANLVGTLGNFTTGGNFTFNSAQSLKVTNPVSANNGAGNITLTTSGAGSDLELATAVKGTTVTLGATGAITQTAAGTIQATTLTGNSSGDTTLTGPNQVGTLGAFSTGGNFSFANAKTLTVTGPLSAPGGTISLSSAAGSGGDLLLNTSINATTVTLAAGGAITQQAGTAIQTSTLTGSAGGQVALDGANLIGTLGSFSAAGFSLTNAQGLTVNGPLTTSGDVSLTTTSGVLDVNTDLSGAAISLSSAGDLTLAHAVNGTSIALKSGGNISQAPTGSLTAATLTGKSVGSTVLGGSGGGIGALGDFSANSFSLTNGQALKVTGVVDGGPSVVLKTTAGDLTIDGTVKGTSTTLTSAGAIAEGDAGVLSAATLTGSSVGATTLTGAHNAVGTLDGFTAKGFSLTSSQALTVNKVLDGGDSVALTTTAGDLTLAGAVNGATTTLTAAGALNEGPNGTLKATTLGGSAGGDATLNGANQIATLGQFAAQNLELTNAQALDVTGPVTIADTGRLHLTTTAGGLTIDGALAGGDVALTAAGDLVFNQAVKGTTLTLVSGGSISQSDTGILTAGTLTGSSVGSTDLDPVNHVDTLGKFSANGFSLATDHALTVSGPVAGGPTLLLKTTSGDLAINGAVSGKATTLVSAGAISEGSGGSLVANTLTGSSVGATTLDAAGNLVDILNAFSANGFSLTTGQALTIAEALSGGATLSLTAGGDILIDAGLSSTGLTTLDATGAITESATGSIAAGTLTGSAGGPTMLGSAAQPIDNLIGTLGGFVSPAGFSLTNNQTLTLASVNGSQYTVDAGTSATYLSVLTGDLLQSGSNWLRNGTGTWSADGAMGAARAPIYVLGVGAQQIDAVGFPPAYFYALDAQGNLLSLTGAASFNVPTSVLTSHAQNSNNHTDAYIDPAIITAQYRAFGVVPPGILLPPDQQACSPDADDCPDE